MVSQQSKNCRDIRSSLSHWFVFSRYLFLLSFCSSLLSVGNCVGSDFDKLNPNFQMYRSRHLKSWTAQLSDKSDAKRVEAIEALILLAFENPDPITTVLKPLLNDSSPRVRIAMLKALEISEPPKEVTQYAFRQVEDSHDMVRAAAFEWLDSNVRDSELVKDKSRLERWIRDRSPVIRKKAFALMLRNLQHEALTARVQNELQNSDLELKLLAIIWLGQIKESALALAECEKFAKDPNPKIRVAAASALVGCKDQAQRAIAALQTLLLDRDQSVRTAAFDAYLRTAESKDATDRTIRWLRSLDETMRLHACQSLTEGLLRFDSEKHPITGILQDIAAADSSLNVRFAALRALQRPSRKHQDVIAKGLSQICKVGNPEIAEKAADLLAFTDKAVALDHYELGQKMRFAEPRVQVALAHALSQHSTDCERLNFLTSFLTHPIVEVRSAAVRAVRELGGEFPQAFAFSLQAIRDPDPTVRQLIHDRKFSARVDPSTQARQFKYALNDKDPFIRLAALEILPNHLQQSQILQPFVADLTKDVSPNIRLAAIQWLLNQDRNFPVAAELQKLTGDSQVEIRRRAVSILGSLREKGTAVVPHLRQMAKTESAENQATIAGALWRIAKDDSHWLSLARSKMCDVRKQAIEETSRSSESDDPIREKILSLELRDAEAANRLAALKVMLPEAFYSRSLADRVAQLLDDGDESVRQLAVQVIAQNTQLPVSISLVLPSLCKHSRAGDLELASRANVALTQIAHFTDDVTESLAESLLRHPVLAEAFFKENVERNERF